VPWVHGPPVRTVTALTWKYGEAKEDVVHFLGVPSKRNLPQRHWERFSSEEQACGRAGLDYSGRRLVRSVFGAVSVDEGFISHYLLDRTADGVHLQLCQVERESEFSGPLGGERKLAETQNSGRDRRRSRRGGLGVRVGGSGGGVEARESRGGRIGGEEGPPGAEWHSCSDLIRPSAQVLRVSQSRGQRLFRRERAN